MKKKAKKKAASRKVTSISRAAASDNLAILAKAGVVIDEDRISDEEKNVIAALSREEVETLVNLHEKFSSVQTSTSPIWRAFCF